MAACVRPKGHDPAFTCAHGLAHAHVQQWRRIVDPQEEKEEEEEEAQQQQQQQLDPDAAAGAGAGQGEEKGDIMQEGGKVSAAAAGGCTLAAAQQQGVRAGGRAAPVLGDAASVVAAKALYVVEVTRARASYVEQQQLLNQVCDSEGGWERCVAHQGDTCSRGSRSQVGTCQEAWRCWSVGVQTGRRGGSRGVRKLAVWRAMANAHGEGVR